MKKNRLKVILTVVLAINLSSCQKQEDTGSMSIQEQYAYMDTTGDEALSQIVPDDFQRLADLMNSLAKDSLDLEFDAASYLRLMSLIGNLTKTKGLVIDTDKISGTLTIDGSDASYKTGDETKLVYKTGNNSYTATLDFTKGSKEVKLGTFEVELIKKNNIDVYLILPKSLTVTVNDNSGLYCGCNARNIDCSEMSADWSNLTLSDLDCSLSGDAYINGKGSYSVKADNVSIGNKRADVDGMTLCGKDAEFLLSGKAGVNFKVKDDWDFEIDTTSLTFYGNIINRIVSKNNAQGNADVYLAGSASPQFCISTSDGDVRFADGTVKPFDDVFNETNMPKTFRSGMSLFLQFAEMFDL